MRSFPRAGSLGRLTALGAAWVGLVCGSGCGKSEPAVDAFREYHATASAGSVRISVGDKAAQELVRASLARRPSLERVFEVAVEPRPRGSASRLSGFSESDDPGVAPRVWIGTAASPGAENALRALGVVKVEGGFSFRGEAFLGIDDRLVATVPDPDRPGAVLSLLLANDTTSAIASIADWTPTSRRAWRLTRAGATIAEGEIDDGGRVREERTLEFAAPDARARTSGERVDYDWNAARDFDAAAEEGWFARLDRAAAAARGRLASLADPGVDLRVELCIHARPEDLARADRTRDDARLGRVGQRTQLALVHAADGTDNAPFEVARALALTAAGESASPWLEEAVAAACADTWYGRPSDAWLAYLEGGNLVVGVERLVRDGAPSEPGEAELSPHLRAPLRGALLQCCEELHGRDFGTRAWRAAPDEVRLPDDATFRAYLDRRLGTAVEAAREARAARRAESRARAHRRGVCLLPSPARADSARGDSPRAHSTAADPLVGGYGTRGAEESLAEIAELGASAVLLCWSSAFEPSPPRIFGDGPARFTEASDAELLFAIRVARGRGLAVTLAPEFLAAEHGGWAGQVSLTTPRRREALFASWSRAITHLGLLAELAGVDVLSLGAEAPDAAVTRPSRENKRSTEELDALRANWRALIAAARGAFAGGLTYAARWDGEAQGIEFWGELDFLGQNAFAPPIGLEGVEAPSAAQFTQQIVASFGHLRELAGREGLAPIVTGLGLSSTAQGWRAPARPLGPVDLDVQTRFLDGLKRALQIARQQDLAPAGLFVWCWWTDPDRGGATDRGFTPQNKPAKDALRRALQVR